MSLFLSQLSAVIQSALRSRPVWFFAILWVLSAITVALSNALSIAFVLIVYEIILILITLVLTQPAPMTTVESAAERRRVYLQLVFIGLIIFLTAYDGLLFHGAVTAEIPLWSTLYHGLAQFGDQYFGSGLNLSNPVLYFVIPLIGLLLLGANWRELGFGQGHRVWQISSLWCVPLILTIVIVMLASQIPVAQLGRSIVSNSLQNGFFEEFLMRGALQSRLRKITSPTWAIVISAMVFGIWHLGLGLSNGGSLPGALALLITFQAFSGLAFGIIFERTRNLIAPSIYHVLANVTGSLMG